MKRVPGLVSAAVLALFLVAFLAPPALAAIPITKAELSGSRLRIEGRGAAPNTTVTVNGGQASGTSDASGNFRIEDSAGGPSDHANRRVPKALMVHKPSPPTRRTR